MDGIKTLQEAILHFSDFENCKAVLARLRWPDGVVKCPRCGSDHVVYLAKNRVWKCYGKHESPKFSLKTGTIFEDSPLGLDKWLAALWLVVNCKNGISSCESARDLGVTQKTAWFMNQRLRFALKNGGLGMLCGEVEADETFIAARRATCTRINAPRRSAVPAPKTRPPSWGSWSAAGKFAPRLFPTGERKPFRPKSAAMLRPVRRC